MISKSELRKREMKTATNWATASAKKHMEASRITRRSVARTKEFTP